VFILEKSILVALDTTPESRHVVHYLSSMFAGQPEFRFHLMGLVPGPASPAKELLDEKELLNLANASTRKKYTEQKNHIIFLRNKLIGSGVPAESLTEEVRFLRSSIASDLLFEAKKGLFDGLVIGRKSIGLLGEVLLGSVSSEILRQNHEIPLWIVSGRIDSSRFMVPVDCSPHTLRAVDHLAFMLKGNPSASITLFHSHSMLSAEKISPKEAFYDRWDKKWCDENLQGEEDGHFHFHAPEQLLRETGFPMDRVTRLQTRKGIEPGQQIVRHVKHDTYGTIVMGRRGSEVDKGIFKGVSDRVLANVEGIAVWLIG